MDAPDAHHAASMSDLCADDLCLVGGKPLLLGMQVYKSTNPQVKGNGAISYAWYTAGWSILITIL